jgi:hypothetical protein
MSTVTITKAVRTAADRLLKKAVAVASAMAARGEDPRPVLATAAGGAELLLGDVEVSRD